MNESSPASSASVSARGTPSTHSPRPVSTPTTIIEAMRPVSQRRTAWPMPFQHVAAPLAPALRDQMEDPVYVKLRRDSEVETHDQDDEKVGQPA